MILSFRGGCPQGKQSFFEKKDQKAFVSFACDSRTRVSCFFFSKKKTLSSLPPHITGTGS
jgi:hypothetical protein